MGAGVSMGEGTPQRRLPIFENTPAGLTTLSPPVVEAAKGTGV